MFVWTTIVGMYYSCEKSVNYIFGDTKANKIATKIYKIYFLIPALFFTNIKADLLWVVTDLITALYILITVVLIFANFKEIMRLFNDFWNRFIPALDKGEKPEPVTYGSVEENHINYFRIYTQQIKPFL